MRFSHTIIAALMAAAGSHAPAAVIAASDFSTDAQGWAAGDYNSIGSTSAPIYNAAAGTISTTDTYGFVGFVAPTAYIGNQSAAFGGSLRFDLGTAGNDGLAFSPVALISGSTVLYGRPVAPPSTTGFTSYALTLVGASFYTGEPYSLNGSADVSDAQLLAVLSSLNRLSIQADWQNGADLTTLDNVSLESPGGAGAVPEPATWGMMILGFGAVGTAARRRRGASVPAA